MRRKVIAGLLIGLGIAWVGIGSAVAQDKAHWLIGTWTGDVDGLQGSRMGASRTMAVSEVAPDGAFKAGFGAGDVKPGDIEGKVAGDAVQLATSNIRLDVNRSDERTLRGTFTPLQTGRAFPITLKKQ